MSFEIFKRFPIALKVGVGYFFLLVIASTGGAVLLYTMLSSQQADEKFADVYIPYLDKVRALEFTVSNTGKLINSWVYNPNEFDKNELRTIHDEELPVLIADLRALVEDRKKYEIVDSLSFYLDDYEENIAKQKTVMESLVTPADYQDEMIVFDIIPLLDDEIIPGIRTSEEQLQKALQATRNQTDILLDEKKASLNRIIITFVILILSAIVVIILHFIYVIKKIVRPINKLNQLVSNVGRGDLSELKVKTASDEVGDMRVSIEGLVNNLKRKSEFAEQIGAGDIYAEYSPISEQDSLGYSLLSMRDNLKKVIFETNKAVEEAGREGNLEARVDTLNSDGAWKDLAESINSLLSSISEPITGITKIVNGLAGGDLSQRYEREAKGQIGQLTNNLNNAMGSLSTLILEITDAANTVQESSTEMLVSGEEMSLNTREIASSISQMSHGAQSQVLKVDESSGLMESMLDSSKEMGTNSEAINSAAKLGVNNSSKGGEMVDNVVKSISQISEYSIQTNQSMKVLNDRSNEISQALTVITEIASQTNLLALNAAIEAAQAGDAGRGFAVVAEEIRKLAEGSRQSAKEIEELIHSVQRDTQKATAITETMSKNVQASVSASKNTAQVFEEIAHSSRETLKFSEDILDATRAQENSISNVVSITESVVVIAEQTASGSEEVASSATELSAGMENYIEKSQRLSGLAEQLKATLGSFKTK